MKYKIEDKIARVQALYSRPGSEGEKQAAARVLFKLKQKLAAVKAYQSPAIIQKYEFQSFDKKI